MASAALPDQPVTKQYRYQPTFPEGHELAGQPMGGEQVIDYDGTTENLAAKLVENNNRMQAEMRRMKAQRTVDPSPDDEPLPADAMSRSSALFKRRDFTTEEAVRFSKGLANPATLQATFDEMAAARVGSSEDFSTLTQLQIRNIESQAGHRFGREHPEITAQPNDTEYTNPYGYKRNVPRDTALLLSWCDKRKLYHTYENLVLAWERLKKAGLLSEAPIAARRELANSQPDANELPVADSPDSATLPTTRRAPVASALSRRNSTPGDRRPVASSGPTWAEFEAMTVEQVRAKPPEWKAAITRLVKQKPNVEVNKLLNIKSMQMKLDLLQ